MNSVFFHLQRGPIIDMFILDINISGWIDILRTFSDLLCLMKKYNDVLNILFKALNFIHYMVSLKSNQNVFKIEALNNNYVAKVHF